MEYYVYQYLREDLTPYYIGKGRGGRMYCRRHNVHLPVKPHLIVVIANRLSDHEARLLEVKLIKLYGRKDNGTGILRNKTDGGDGVSGIVQSATTRAKRAASLMGNTNGRALKGRKKAPFTAEHCANLSIAFYGRKASTETKNKMSVGRMGNQNSVGKNTHPVLHIHAGIFFDSVKDAAEHYGMRANTLCRQLNGYIPNRTPLVLV